MESSARVPIAGLVCVGMVAGVASLGTSLVAAESFAGATDVVSVSSEGVRGDADSESLVVDMSADGRWVVFESDATNLVDGDTNGEKDVFIHDRHERVTERVSVATGGAQADGPSERPSISADGRYVAFQSIAPNLGGPDGSQVYVHDREANTTTWVSVLQPAPGAFDSPSGFQPQISADGDHVVYVSDRQSHGFGAPFASHVVLRVTIASLLVELVSASNLGPAPVEHDGGRMVNESPAVSDDGRFVAFESNASDLVAGDTNAAVDVFLRDMDELTTVRLSVASDGTEANAGSHRPQIAGDGSLITFVGQATNLVDDDETPNVDVFVHNPRSGTTELVSVDEDGAAAGGFNHAISGDGSAVVFDSNASGIVAGAAFNQLYVRDLLSRTTQLVTRTTFGGAPGRHFTPFRFVPGVSNDGDLIGFPSTSDEFIVGDDDSFTDVFVVDASGLGPVLPDPDRPMPVPLPEPGPVQCPGGAVPFVDVSSSSFAADDIACIFRLGITTGTGPVTYDPGGVVTREQMAAFIARLWRVLGEGCPGGAVPFVDVSSSSFAADDIACIFRLGITTGTGPVTYDPGGVVTREQMAAFIARLWRVLGEGCPGGAAPFVDVSSSSFAADDIACIFRLGITTGTGPVTYDPGGVVTREQMAAFIARVVRAVGSGASS